MGGPSSCCRTSVPPPLPPRCHAAHLSRDLAVHPPRVQVPRQRYRLALLPTPIHRWHVPGVPPGCELHIKRDDLTGMQLSGNKVGGRAGLGSRRLPTPGCCAKMLGGSRRDSAAWPLGHHARESIQLWAAASRRRLPPLRQRCSRRPPPLCHVPAGAQAGIPDGRGKRKGPRLHHHHWRHSVESCARHGEGGQLPSSGRRAWVGLPRSVLAGAACCERGGVVAAAATRASQPAQLCLLGMHTLQAVAARYLGMECHLILRNSRHLADAGGCWTLWVLRMLFDAAVLSPAARTTAAAAAALALACAPLSCRGRRLCRCCPCPCPCPAPVLPLRPMAHATPTSLRCCRPGAGGKPAGGAADRGAHLAGAAAALRSHCGTTPRASRMRPPPARSRAPARWAAAPHALPLCSAHMRGRACTVLHAGSRPLAARAPAPDPLPSPPTHPPPAKSTNQLGQVTKEEYGRFGGPALGERLAAQLRAQGLNPFVIPVGGSSSMGVWG